MESYLGILNTDTVNRDGIMFTLGALEQGMFDNALEGMPSLISHDFHRPTGWILPNGLYLEPKISKSIGRFLIAETADDFALLREKVQNRINRDQYEQCKDSIDEFKMRLGEHYSETGRFHRDSCVSYIDDGVLLKVFPKFDELKDKNGLIFLNDLLKDFEYVGCGTFKSIHTGFSIFCHQYFRRSLSRLNNFNTYFIDSFLQLHQEEGIRLRIALDENAIGLTATYSGSFEFDYWWGPKFNDDISKIPNEVTRYECIDESDKFFSGISGTEFWWKSEKNEKTFEMEEIRETASLGVSNDSYGCRYVHSIFDTDKNEFNHFDGAIRLYNDESILKRWNVPINKAGKDTGYTKLFRIDGKLALADWKRMTILYYHGNPLIYEYFGVKEEYKALQPKEDQRSRFEELVPYKIDVEDGVRIYITYHPIGETKPFQDRLMTNVDVISYPNEKIEVVEHHALEIKKILQRNGANISFPDGIAFIKTYDHYVNFPTILHGQNDTQNLLDVSLDAYRTYFSFTASKSRASSFSLAWIKDDKEVRVSIFGKDSELATWLQQNPVIPIEHDLFRGWLEQQKKWLAKNYPSSNSDLISLLKFDGVQFIKRKIINHDLIQNIRFVGADINYEVAIPESDDKLVQLAVEERIFPSYMSFLEKVSCSKTKENYFTSNTSKILDNDVKMNIEEQSLAGFFWTDKAFS